MKSEQQKLEMIERLKESKNNLPHHSMFGDDNWAAIDYQIKVIQEDLDQDDVYDRELPSETEMLAVLAAQWLNDEISDEELLGED